MQVSEEVAVTGSHIRGQLAAVMGSAMTKIETGMDHGQATATRAVCTAANSITSNLRAELEHRKQNIALGYEVSEEIGEMRQA
jgi:hypothetical protein